MNYTVVRYVTQHSQCSSVQSLAYFAMSFTPQILHQNMQNLNMLLDVLHVPQHPANFELSSISTSQKC